MPERITDPTQLPVQLNVNVPFHFRETLRGIATKRRVSLNSLVVEALEKEYLATEVHAQTRDAGATS